MIGALEDYTATSKVGGSRGPKVCPVEIQVLPDSMGRG